jgi:hypothetical protein
VQKTGVVCSYQDWEYREKEVTYIVEGEGGKKEIKQTVIEKDAPRIRILPVENAPRIRILPVENVRIHPASDWTDPVNSSPFLIIKWPMYVKDVKARMRKVVSKTGETRWRSYNDEEIKSASKFAFDSTRLVREQRTDKYDNAGTDEVLSDFDVVWVHENIMAMPSGDVIYFTLGTRFMLTDPVALEEVHFHGERPVVMGTGCIETHKIYPDSLVELGSELQREINETRNQRSDNVKLVMNKRYFVKDGRNINLKNLLRNVAGGATVMPNPKEDVVPVEFHDVTSSSYQEEDRLNVAYDDIAGAFSTSSVMNNRKLNETVGGMQMMRTGANSLVEYLIKTFSETWFESVIKQIIKLEQNYETDMVILSVAAQKAKLFMRYGMDEVTDEMLNQNLLVSVNAGIGASDPMVMLDRFSMGIARLTEVAEKQANLPMPVLKIEEVAKEIFGRLGYKDGVRFTYQQEGANQQLMFQIEQMGQAIQQLQAQLEDKQADRQVKLVETGMKEDGQDRRKAAELKTRIQEKIIDLRNPVVGEKNVGSR